MHSQTTVGRSGHYMTAGTSKTCVAKLAFCNNPRVKCTTTKMKNLVLIALANFSIRFTEKSIRKDKQFCVGGTNTVKAYFQQF